jgi:hypothetical protein
MLLEDLAGRLSRRYMHAPWSEWVNEHYDHYDRTSR